MSSNQTTTERPDDPAPEFLDDMSEAQHRLIAHDVLRRAAEHLSKRGIKADTIISALFGVAAGELVWREGAAVTAASLRDFADAIERHDIQQAGHA